MNNFYIVNHIKDGSIVIEQFDADLVEWFNKNQFNGIVETPTYIVVGPFTKHGAKRHVKSIRHMAR